MEWNELFKVQGRMIDIISEYAIQDLTQSNHSLTD